MALLIYALYHLSYRPEPNRGGVEPPPHRRMIEEIHIYGTCLLYIVVYHQNVTNKMMIFSNSMQNKAIVAHPYCVAGK